MPVDANRGRRNGKGWTGRAMAVTGVLMATATGATPAATGATTTSTPVTTALSAGKYIVSAATETSAADAVRAAGGAVLARLPIAGAVEAQLDAAAARLLSGNHSVAVTPDISMSLLGQSYGSSGPVSASAPQLTRLDVGPVWAPQAGAGVGVALIDTGVADTPGIDPSHIVRSPDFSGSGKTYDGYGHGTFMAGLIAGDGAGGSGAVPGVAPGATIVAVKVAGDDGSTTLAQVLEGIGWAVANRTTYNIKVMSLSFGADLHVPPPANPLDRAVEAAWASGITVVAAAGNGGAGQVSSPGDDPAVVTVGAETTTGPVQAPSWSSYSATKPDVTAPGVSVVSLRDPGSVVDTQNPSARIGTAYFVGSGTSMSTALTAGAAALLSADHPATTPDQVKAALVSTSGPALSGPAGPADVTAADRASAWTAPDRSHPGPALGSSRRNPPAGAGPVSADTMHWDTMHWDTMHWDTMHWDTMHWDTMHWDTMHWDTMHWDTMHWDTMHWDASAWADESWGQ